MKFVTCDPGLDLVAFALWDWTHWGQDPARALQKLETIDTDTGWELPRRIMKIATETRRILGPARGQSFIIEVPMRGIYGGRDKPGMLEAVMKSMVNSSMATGAIVVGADSAGMMVRMLKASSMKKQKKYDLGVEILDRSTLVLPGRRRQWGKDEADAVVIGVQVMQDPSYRYLCGTGSERAETHTADNAELFATPAL